MTIRNKILIGSFAKLMMFKKYDIRKYAISIGASEKSPAIKLLDEILSIDMRKPEIQYILNKQTVLSLRSKEIITDYTQTNISIQDMYGDDDYLEERIETFNGMPLHSDEAYLRLASIMFSYNRIWGNLNAVLFKEMIVDGQPEKLAEGQQENFLYASREIVAWTLLRTLDNFTIPVKDKFARLGLKRMLTIISDEHINMSQETLAAMYKAFQIKKRLHPSWKEIAISFGYLGFKPMSVRKIAKELSYRTVGNYTSLWKREPVELTQIFDNESTTVRKFLITMNRVRTRSNAYVKHIKKSVTVLEALIKAGV